jgi:PAS domain S-box-containing protein
MYHLGSQLNSNSTVHYKAAVDHNTRETDLIVLVRETRHEDEHSELDALLRDFVTELLKRRLVAKVDLLQAMEVSGAGAANASSNPIHSRATNSKLLAISQDAIVVINDRVIEFTKRIFMELKSLKVLLLRAHETLTRLAWSVADKPLRLREELRARENNLRKLLTTSFDAIVVADGDRRFVQANSRALELFGISERNITMFTMDAFLPHRQILEFDENCASSINRKERYGECKIKRLDGRLLVATYTFIAKVVPRRNLYRFRDVAPRKITQVGFRPQEPVSYGQKHWAINPISVRRASES